MEGRPRAVSDGGAGGACAARRRPLPGFLSVLRHRLEYVSLLALFRLLRTLPEKRALAFGEHLGEILYKALGRRRRVAEINLRLAFPELSEEARRSILLRSARNLARVSVETIRIPVMSDDEIRGRVRYGSSIAEKFEQARRRGKGIIFITGHIGNWEFLALAHALNGHPIRVVVRPFKNPHFDERMRAVRSRGGNGLFERDDDPDGIRKVLGYLRGGGALGILADQCPQAKDGILVPFFGKLAWSHRGPALLALRSGAMVVPAFIHGDPRLPGKYSVEAGEEIEAPSEGSGAERLRVLTARIQTALEAEIRSSPEDWFWIHRRWKRSPDAACAYPSVHQRRRRRVPAPAAPVQP